MTAVDVDGGTNVSAAYDATVMEAAAEPAIAKKTQAEVDAVFKAAGDLVAEGPDRTVDMSKLFTTSGDAEPTYSALSDMPAILKASASGMMLTLDPMSAGSAMITVTATDSASSTIVSVMYTATVGDAVAPAITAKSQADVDKAFMDAIAMAAGDGQWDAGGAKATLAASALFVVPDGITPSYQVSSANTAVVGAAVEGMDMVALTPLTAGSARITVTAIDVAGGTNVSATYDATVMEAAAEPAVPAVVAKSQAEVDMVFMDAGAGDLVEGGPAVMVDMSKLFTMSADAEPTYTALSDMPAVLAASSSGMMLTLTPMSAGASMVMVTAVDSGSRTIVDVTYSAMVDKKAPVLTITSDPMDMVKEGGTIKVIATLNQEAPHDKAIKLQVSGPAEPSEAEIMLKTGEMSAYTMLTVMDDYEVAPMSDIIIVASHEAIPGGSAVLTLTVTENDTAITYELVELVDTNIVEGMEYELTAMASSAVPMDTEVMLVRDRAKSEADDDDFTAAPIMIMAGETMGKTMLMVKEDSTPDGGTGTNMGESLVLFGMVGNIQTENSLTFTIWDAAVPALPLIAQLLLAAFLAIGGYRRYLRW